MLLDTASMYFRAFYGVPDTIRAPDGTPVNAVRGLLDFISRLVTDYRPTHLVLLLGQRLAPAVAGRPDPVVQGAPGRVRRRPERPTSRWCPIPLEVQVPVIREVLAAFGIAVVGADGYEADDVIGTLATDAGMPVDVVTGDRDLFQLVDDDAQVRILYIARGVGRHERVTNSVVREKYGIDGRQYADFAALRGDPSDGLPGVNGIGEKTATTLLQRFETIAGLQAAVEDPDSNIAPSPRRKIREAAEYLVAAPAVTAVARSIDLGPLDLTLPLTPADPDRLVAMSEQWNLESPIARLVEALTDLR